MIERLSSAVGATGGSSNRLWNKDESFGKIITDMLKDTNQQMLDADKAIEAFAAGKIENVHDVMIATEKASLSFQLTLQVRNKVIEAYQELMRMQV